MLGLLKKIQMDEHEVVIRCGVFHLHSLALNKEPNWIFCIMSSQINIILKTMS